MYRFNWIVDKLLQVWLLWIVCFFGGWLGLLVLAGCGQEGYHWIFWLLIGISAVPNALFVLAIVLMFRSGGKFL